MRVTVQFEFADDEQRAVAEFAAKFAQFSQTGSVPMADEAPNDTPVEPKRAPPPVREDEQPAGGRALPKVKQRGRPPYKQLRLASGISERELLSRAWRASGGDIEKATAALQEGKLAGTGPKGVPTTDDVKSVVKAFTGAHGIPALMKRLQEANVTRVTELKDQKLIRFLDALAADTPETLDSAVADAESGGDEESDA